MYAIIEVAGKQFKVKENDTVIVPRLDADVDSSVTFDRVLLISNDGDVTVGTPTVDGASVTATVVDHPRGNKVVVFKKKRRKRGKGRRGGYR